MDKKKINSIAEMCEVSSIFKCYVNVMKQTEKNVSELAMLAINDKQTFIDFNSSLEAKMKTIIDVYDWDKIRLIDTEAIEKEIAELKEKVIQEYIERSPTW